MIKDRTKVYLNSQAPAIVLIEKDEVTLELYQRELSKTFTVFAFTEFSGIMETIASKDIQAVVIEPEIHSGQGWELIHSIHTAFPDRSIPVIVCSTLDPSNTDLTKEITKHLTKPVLPKTLKEKTLEVLSKKDDKWKNS
jgi:DNA-binding NtrC family response regulator